MSSARGESAFQIFLLDRGSNEGSAFVFVCYLDDSDSYNGPTLGIGGYLARLDHWAAFERVVAPYLDSWAVETLRGKDFHNGHNSFKNWCGSDKAKFVDGLYRLAAPHIVLGISSTLNKSFYKSVRCKYPQFNNVSPLGAAFTSTVGGLFLKDAVSVWNGLDFTVSFMIELGNKNNGNLERYFRWLKSDPNIGPKLKTIGLVDKSDCRAIQLADFLAFHGRREADRWDKSGYADGKVTGDAMTIMSRHIFHRHNRMFDDGKPSRRYNIIPGPTRAVAESENIFWLPPGGLK